MNNRSEASASVMSIIREQQQHTCEAFVAPRRQLNMATRPDSMNEDNPWRQRAYSEWRDAQPVSTYATWPSRSRESKIEQWR
jgi:hypothetical protein